MKFDANLAAAKSSELNSLDRVEATWRESGWVVGRESCPARLPLPRLSRAIQAGLLFTGLILGRFGSGILQWVGYLVAVWCLLQLTRGKGFRLTRRTTVNVLTAAKSSQYLPKFHVVTHVSRATRRLGGQRRTVFGLITLAGAIGLLVCPEPWLWAVAAAMVPVLTFLVFDLWPNQTTSTNATGGAFLEELARTWPEATRKLLDPCFILTDAPIDALVKLGFAGGSELFMIEVVDPGQPGPLRLSGYDLALDLADGAAQDLWIPHTRSLTLPMPTIEQADFEGFVRVEGTPDPGHPRANANEPAALGRTAQLVLEIALRWGKRRDQS